MVDVLLINPPLNSWIVKATKGPPLGLAYLASSLRKEGIEVKILDSLAERKTEEETFHSVERISPRIVGIYTASEQMRSCLDLAEKIKSLGIQTVLGGPFITSLPGIFNRYKCFDHAFIGEGEITFPKFVKELLKGKINRRKIVNGKIPEDLDSLPHPSYDLLPMKKYYTPFKGLPYSIVMSSRGCPFNCIYCYHSRKVRFRSPDNIVEELNLLINEYGVKWIQFWDDIFTLNRKRIMSLCEKIIEEKLDFEWQCQTRIDCVDRKLLEKMYKAGCREIGFGIESSSYETRLKIGKNFKNSTIERVIKTCKKVGIETLMNIMLGLPEERKKDMIKSLEYTIRLDSDYALFHLTVAYPKTRLFEMGITNGIFSRNVWYDYIEGKNDVPYYLDGLTIEELKRMQSYAFRRFYLRPEYISKRLLRARSFQDIVENFHAALSLPFW